jgi:TonB family protein
VWVVAVGVVFVMVGGVGLMRPVSGVGWVEPAAAGQVEVLAEAEAAAGGVMVEMVEMVERSLMGEERAAVVEPVLVEPAAVEPVASSVVPEVSEVLDEPLLVKVLDADELLAVPPAAAVEAMVEPLARGRAEPRVNPAVPRRAATATATGTTGAAAAATTGATAGATGAAGRPGGMGVARLPAPPYPSFARSRGLQGTTFLSITVSPSGSVAKVEVAGSSGYSELDRYAAGWVQKRWRWPAGDQRIFRQPVVFRLR